MGFCPPIHRFVYRASLIEVPVQMQRGRYTLPHAKCHGDNKKENASVKDKKDQTTHRFLEKIGNPYIEMTKFPKPLTPPSPHRGEDEDEGVLY